MEYIHDQDRPLEFADALERAEDVRAKEKPWRILIVDDDDDVHRVTRLVLSRFRFMDRGMELVSAFSSEEAKRVIDEPVPIAIILLDVVMEEPDSGLTLADYIRRDLGNRLTRIILRTGQPGQAPESRVIVDYDINDYKAKTELTEQKLVTSVVAALRAYSDLVALERSRKGLESIIKGAARVFEPKSLKRLAAGVLEQASALLSIENDAVPARISGVTAIKNGDGFEAVCASGRFEGHTDRPLRDFLPAEICEKIEYAAEGRESLRIDDGYIGYFRSARGSQNLIYLEGCGKIDDTEAALMDVFCSGASVAFDNVYLNEEIEESQREIIFTLGDIVDRRSRETGNHVRRVAEYCRLLAAKAGFREHDIRILRIASSMHDIGKLGIPDEILDKRGVLASEEYETMKTHAEIGASMLKRSNRELLQAAAAIALQHHERFDGSGYPAGLKGEDIHRYARITAIADVFDALSHDRVYRKAMDREDIIAYFRGKDSCKFDPRLLSIFLENIDEFYAIQQE